MTKVERFIARLRESSPWMVELFTHGGCWQFYLILRAVWPNAEPWYAWDAGHVYSKIGSVWYDIRGKHVAVSDAVAFTRIDGAMAARAHRWLPRAHAR